MMTMGLWARLSLSLLSALIPYSSPLWCSIFFLVLSFFLFYSMIAMRIVFRKSSVLFSGGSSICSWDFRRLTNSFRQFQLVNVLIFDRICEDIYDGISFDEIVDYLGLLKQLTA
jgi:hypothetical protein